MMPAWALRTARLTNMEPKSSFVERGWGGELPFARTFVGISLQWLLYHFEGVPSATHMASLCIPAGNRHQPSMGPSGMSILAHVIEHVCGIFGDTPIKWWLNPTTACSFHIPSI